MKYTIEIMNILELDRIKARTGFEVTVSTIVWCEEYVTRLFIQCNTKKDALNAIEKIKDITHGRLIKTTGWIIESKF